MKNQISIYVVLLLVLPCSQVEWATQMVFPGETWEETSPESQNVSSVKLKIAVSYLLDCSGRNGIKRLIIVRNGRVIWKGAEADHRQRVWSVTKAFTSTAHGLLIEDGKCTLETLAKDYNPKDLSEYYPKVTLRIIL